MAQSTLLTGFEQENGHLAQVEVDEVFGFTCHITTEVPPQDAVPGGVVLLVEILLDMGRNVLLYIISLQCLSSTLHRVLLHLLRHIGILYYGLSVTHGCLRGEAKAKDEELGVWAAGAVSPVHSARPTPPPADAPHPTSQEARAARTEGGRSPAGDEAGEWNPLSFSPRSRGWPTATVSWGRGWRGSHLSREGVATEALAHLIVKENILNISCLLAHYY